MALVPQTKAISGIPAALAGLDDEISKAAFPEKCQFQRVLLVVIRKILCNAMHKGRRATKWGIALPHVKWISDSLVDLEMEIHAGTNALKC